MPLRTVGVRLAAEVSGYVNNMRAAGVATKDFVGDLDKAAKAGRLDAVADSAMMMGLGLAGAFAGVVAVTAKFDKQMSEVGAVSNATAAEMDKLRAAALEAGKATSFSATEAAKAQAELAKAGLSTSEILGGALSGSLSLAAAGTLDLAESADIAAKTMNVFQLEGKDVGHIADVLSAAANKSATDVHEMGEALRMGGMAANAAGLSLEETVGTLAAFADRALVGSDAGTSLKTALIMLQAPTDKSKAVMEKLGIAAYDAGGNFVGMANLAGQLQRQLGGLTQEQRNAALAQIFGADAMRAANVLYSVGEQGIRDYVAAVDDQGAAAEVAAKKMDNLAGDIEKLKGSLETMAIEAGSGSTSGLRMMVQTADNLVTSLGNIPAPIQTALVAVAGIGGAMLLTAAAAIKLRRSTADAMAELGGTGPAGARMAAGLDVATKALGRVAVGLAAVQVASAALGSSVNPQTEALGSGLLKWADSGQVAGESARIFGGDLGKLDTALKDIGDTGRWSTMSRGIGGFAEGISGLGGVMDDSLQKSKERLAGLDSALAQLVQSGRGQEAAELFNAVAERAKEQGVSVAELNQILPGYAGAVETAGNSSEGAAGKVGEVGDAAAAAAGEVEKLKEAFDALFGVYMTADQAAIKYQESIDSLSESVQTNGTSLDINTEKGRANTSQILTQIEAIKGIRDSNLAQGMAIGDANKAYDTQMGKLRATLTQMGFNKTAIDQLIGKYREIPGKVSTTAVANTAPATNAIAKLVQYAKAVDGTTIRIATEVSGYVGSGARAFKRWGGVTEYRGGRAYQHAAEGRLRDAQIASPVGPARYAWAEQQTGGEAFIPKFGDFNRSVGILSRAADWYGMGVYPKSRMAAMGSRGQGPTAMQIGAAVATHLAPALAGQRGTGGDTIVNIDGIEVARATRSGERNLVRRG